MSNHWYDKAVYYQMYPPGIIGAPKENPTQITDIPPDQDPSKGFLELDLRVSHSKESGCSALYIGPLFESSFHGYDTRDYKLMDKRLGTNDDFVNFVKLCHKAGIRAVADGILNHTRRKLFAFQDIPQKKDYLTNRQYAFACHGEIP